MVVSSLLCPLSDTVLHTSPPKITVTPPQKKIQLGFTKKLSWTSPILQKSAPLVASVAILLWTDPANAGFLSGFSGIESLPGPELPQIDFLKKLNEENQKKYAEFDERFKESPLLKELLERSKLNKEKNFLFICNRSFTMCGVGFIMNRKEIQDKYCIRGAEWGVGDCSVEAMSPADREKFIETLKQKLGDGAE